MNHTLYIIFLLLPLLAATAADSPAPPPAASVNCTDELVTFSTCLPYVAFSPNNRSDSPSVQCCDDISAAFTSGSAVCLCYFVLRPKILGFPLNSTKLMSLTSICPLKDRNSNSAFSLETICSVEQSGSAPLPPLHGITGPSNPKSSIFGFDSPPSPVMGPPESGRPVNPGTTDQKPIQPGLSNLPANSIIPSATERIHKINLTFLIFLGTPSLLARTKLLL